jgi:hypothetical protein
MTGNGSVQSELNRLRKELATALEQAEHHKRRARNLEDVLRGFAPQLARAVRALEEI